MYSCNCIPMIAFVTSHYLLCILRMHINTHLFHYKTYHFTWSSINDVFSSGVFSIFIFLFSSFSCLLLSPSSSSSELLSSDSLLLLSSLLLMSPRISLVVDFVSVNVERGVEGTGGGQVLSNVPVFECTCSFVDNLFKKENVLK